MHSSSFAGCLAANVCACWWTNVCLASEGWTVLHSLHFHHRPFCNNFNLAPLPVLAASLSVELPQNWCATTSPIPLELHTTSSWHTCCTPPGLSVRSAEDNAGGSFERFDFTWYFEADGFFNQCQKLRAPLSFLRWARASTSALTLLAHTRFGLIWSCQSAWYSSQSSL